MQSKGLSKVFSNTTVQKHYKSSAKRKVHSNTGIPQKTRKKSKWLHHFTFLPAIYDTFNFSTSLSTLAIVCLFDGSVQFSSVAQWCLTLCNPMDCSTPGFPVHHQLLEFTQTQICRVGDAIQPSHPLSSPSPPVPNPSQHQGLFK